MKKKGWLTPIFVFVLFMFCLFWYEPYEAAPSPVQLSEEVFSPWHELPDKITALKLSSIGREVSVTLAEDYWYVNDHDISADSAYVYGIISSFQSPHVISITQMGGVIEEDFGIDEYSTSIHLYDDEDIEYLLIQGMEATDSTYYVYSPTIDTVFTMHQSHFDQLSFDLDIWRNKDFLNFSVDTTSSITIDTAGKTYTLTKDPSGENDFICSTLKQDSINNIIDFLYNLRITNFIVDDATENIISTYALDAPQAVFTINSTDGTSTSFSISESSNDNSNYYVLAHNTNDIYTISVFQ